MQTTTKTTTVRAPDEPRIVRVDYEKIVRAARALEAHLLPVFHRYAVEGSDTFIDVCDLTSCLDEMRLIEDVRSEVVAFLTDVLVRLDQCDASRDVDYETFKLIHNAAKEDARGSSEPKNRWVAAEAEAEALAAEQEALSEEEAELRHVKQQQAKAIATASERVRARNEELRALIERRYMTRHVERQIVEEEYTKARRHAAALRRQQQGKRATYKEDEEPEYVPMGMGHAADVLSRAGIGHSEGTRHDHFEA
tara:strand:+ start:1495 stop:2250 length:756 start_codon:yes stop_codon:yes gene_type:complete